jgi:hypothetical protein
LLDPYPDIYNPAELLGPGALDDGWRATSLHVALKLHRP